MVDQLIQKLDDFSQNCNYFSLNPYFLNLILFIILIVYKVNDNNNNKYTNLDYAHHLMQWLLNFSVLGFSLPHIVDVSQQYIHLIKCDQSKNEAAWMILSLTIKLYVIRIVHSNLNICYYET